MVPHHLYLILVFNIAYFLLPKPIRTTIVSEPSISILFLLFSMADKIIARCNFRFDYVIFPAIINSLCDLFDLISYFKIKEKYYIYAAKLV